MLRLYPGSFRQEYSDDLLLLFNDLVRNGSPNLRRRLVLDLFVSLPHLLLETAMRSDADPTRLIVGLTVLASGALIVTLGFGLGGVGLVIGGLAALAFLAIAITQRSALGKAFSRPVDRGERSGLVAALTQAWWAPIAAVHGVLTLIFGVAVGMSGEGGQADSIMGAAITMAFGVAVLWGLVLRVERVAIGTGMVLIGSVWFGGAFWLVWPVIMLLIIWVGVITSTLRTPRVPVGAA